MDRFPARQQNHSWSSRQQFPNPTLTNASFTAPSRVGTAPNQPVFDSVVSAVPDRTSVSASGTSSHSGRRPGAAVNRKGGNKPTSSDADKLFKMKMVEKSAQQVLGEKLKEVVYDSNACREMCPVLASAILNMIQGFTLQQYKLVCVVSVGSLKEKPGVKFGSRCLWNKDTDNFVSVKYSNGSVYAVAMIFGLYFD